jgi:hypothetical protein
MRVLLKTLRSPVRRLRANGERAKVSNNLSVHAEPVEAFRSFFLKAPRTLIALWVTALFMTAVPVVVKADVEGLLGELNRKPAPERTKALVEGAQKERVVYYYGSTSLSDTQEVIRGFNQEYPFV